MRLTVSRELQAPTDEVFAWFYDSTNYAVSPLVFGVKLENAQKPAGLMSGSRRTIYMVGGVYHEQITDIVPGQSITYRVYRSFPPVIQEFTQVRCVPLEDNKTRLEWEIDLQVPIPFISRPVTRFAGAVASRLYGSIVDAAACSWHAKHS